MTIAMPGRPSSTPDPAASPTPAARPTAAAARPAPMVGNALDAVAGLLAGLGLAPTHRRATVEEVVVEEAQRRGLQVQVHSMRYGVITLATNPQDAVLLRMDLEHIKDAANARLDEPITSLTVRVLPAYRAAS